MIKMSDKQLRLFNTIKSLGRLMNEDELVDYYVEHHMTDNPNCKFDSWTYYAKKTAGKDVKRKDFVSEWSYQELKSRASIWHIGAIGRLVLIGALKISIPITRKEASP